MNADGMLAWDDAVTGESGRLLFDARVERGRGAALRGSQWVDMLADLPPVTYTCALAVETGAYAEGKAPALGLHWNTSAPAWASAAWTQGALSFTYQMQQQVIVGQQFYDFAVTFTDAQTGSTWTPQKGTFGCLIDENFVFTLSLEGGVQPPPDDRSGQSGSIPTAFPFLLSFQLSPTATELAGAMLTEVRATSGTVVGVTGSTPGPSVVGDYVVEGRAGSFAVHGGTLRIGGEVVGGAALAGHTLRWSGLSPAQCTASGLPAAGTAEFDEAGHAFTVDGGTGRGARRSGAEGALEAAPGAGLSLATLALMTPFVYDGGWYDGVQQAAMADFNQILLYFMDPALRHAYWDQSAPTLPAQLQQVAAMAPAGEDPAAWYQSLSVAFLTNALAQWPQAGADTLNATRASAWLTGEVSTSGVYALQSQALYALEYQNANPAIAAYKADQAQNADVHAAQIEGDAAAWLAEVRGKVADPAAAASVAEMVEELSTTAVRQSLYWAYTYFRYATGDAPMAALRMMALGEAGDPTAYLRRVQSDAAVLSMLDPTHLFANTYLAAVQAQTVASLLPTMADYGNPQPGLAAAVAAVLDSVAATYAGATDPVLSSIASQAGVLGARGDLADLVAAMQGAAGRVGGSGGWVDAAAVMAQAVSPTVGPTGANLLCASLAALVVGGAAEGGAEKGAGLSPGTLVSMARYTTQVVYVAVKWGVALNASLGGGPLTWAALKGLFSTEMLVQANRNLESGFTRWLVGNRLVDGPSPMLAATLQEDAADNRAMVVRVFGRNLDEFVGVRLAAVFSLASLVAAAIALHGATDTAGEVQGWLAVSASALSFAASAGEWAVQAFGLAQGLSTMFSALGALGMVAAAAGIAYTLYRWFKAVPTELQQFASAYAQPAGFFMPHAAEIDQFTGYTREGEPSRVALSWAVPGGGGAVLAVGADGTPSQAPLDFGYATLLYVRTDGTGRSAVASAAGGTVRLLTVADDGTVRFAAPLPSTDPGFQGQRWCITLQSAAQMDGEYPQSGAFTVSSQAGGITRYLAWQGGAAVLSSAPAAWTLEQRPMAVAGLSMPDLALLTFSRGASASPSLAQPGSVPQAWVVTPALPSFLTLDAATGVILVPAAAPQPLPETAPSRHTLSVSNGVPGPAPSATFLVSVTAPSAA